MHSQEVKLEEQSYFSQSTVLFRLSQVLKIVMGTPKLLHTLCPGPSSSEKTCKT